MVKLFRRTEVTHEQVLDPLDNEIVTRATWDEECTDYERLAKHPDLEIFAPKYYGRVCVSEVLNEEGRNVLAEYVPDCAFEMEFVPGKAQKLGSLPEELLWSRVDEVLDRFGEIGIRNSFDGSAFVPGSRAEFTFIDFASLEAWTKLTDYLAEHGNLPPHARERWRRPFRECDAGK